MALLYVVEFAGAAPSCFMLLGTYCPMKEPSSVKRPMLESKISKLFQHPLPIY